STDRVKVHRPWRKGPRPVTSYRELPDRRAGPAALAYDGPRFRPVCGVTRSNPRLLLGLARSRAVIAGEDGDEGLLRNLHGTHHLHPLLAFLLLLQQLPLTGDVTAVALGENVLADGADGLTGDDPRADGGLHRHLEVLPRDQLLQLGDQPYAVRVRLVLVGDRREGVHLVAVQQDVDLDQGAALLAGGLVVEGGVAARLGLQLVEEVEDDLRQRQGVADLDP